MRKKVCQRVSVGTASDLRCVALTIYSADLATHAKTNSSMARRYAEPSDGSRRIGCIDSLTRSGWSRAWMRAPSGSSISSSLQWRTKGTDRSNHLLAEVDRPLKSERQPKRVSRIAQASEAIAHVALGAPTKNSTFDGERLEPIEPRCSVVCAAASLRALHGWTTCAPRSTARQNVQYGTEQLHRTQSPETTG